jgi:hypothetical protein
MTTTPQGQQLRALQAFDRHLHAPFKDGFEQTIEGLNGLGPELMKHSPHFHTAVPVGIRRSLRSDQLTAAPLALASQLGIVVLGIAQHIAYLPRQLLQQQGSHLIVAR